jgi:hypothetical protein
MSITSEAQGFGITTKLWFGITPIIFAFFLLANINNDVDFDVALAFISIFVVSLLILSYYSKGENKNYLRQFNAFWLSDITGHKALWLLLSTGGIFGAWGVAIITDSQFIGIILSGGVLMIAFLKTGSILVPIFSHGIWNTFVVAADQGFFGDIFAESQALASIPITVPEIGIGLPGFANFFTEMIWQLTLVSTSEEAMKVAILVFVLVALRRGRNFIDGSTALIIGAVAAITIWSVLHTINTVVISFFIAPFGLI